MTTYVTRQVQVQVAERSSGEGLIFKRGDRSAKFDALDTLNEARFEKYVLAIPTTDQDLMIGASITAGRILYIETDTEITVKLDDTTDTGFVVKPVPTTVTDDKRGVLYLEGNFTHVYATVAGASGSANILIGIVGA